jgi:transcriptional regulator with XRE-family HTH domain
LKLDRDNLIRARERLGYSVETVAQEAGIAKNSVLRAEHGEHIRPLTARKIAAALGIEVADLYADPDYPKEGAPPWLEPTFNDVIQERRLSRFADAIASAADKWLEVVSKPETPDATAAGALEAAARLYGALMDGITRSEWETLTTQERGEFAEVMDKLAKVGAEGILRLQESGYFDAERTRIQREMMRKWTDRISA